MSITILLVLLDALRHCRGKGCSVLNHRRFGNILVAVSIALREVFTPKGSYLCKVLGGVEWNYSNVAVFIALREVFIFEGDDLCKILDRIEFDYNTPCGSASTSGVRWNWVLTTNNGLRVEVALGIRDPVLGLRHQVVFFQTPDEPRPA